MYDDIAKNGGTAIMWKTGHSLIKQKMKDVQAELAGEMSGHIFFADRYLGFDDATYAGCRLLEILARTGQPIGRLLADVPKTFNTPEIRVECPENIKFRVVKRVTEYFKSRQEVIDIDGARVLFGDGWGLVRASNTQPVLVLRFEALSEKRLMRSGALWRRPWRPSKQTCNQAEPLQNTIDKKIFITLFFALFATVTGVGIVVPLLPVYAHNLGASGLYIGLIFGSFSISRTCLLPYFGRLSDRTGRKPIIVIGLLAYAVVSVAFLLSTKVSI